MKKIAGIVSVVLGLCLIHSCFNDKEEELYPAQFAAKCDTTKMSYASAIKTIINAKCATSGCHVAGAQSPNLADTSIIKTQIGRIKERALNKGDMPKSGSPGLSDCEKKKLKAWIDRGNPIN